MTHSSSHSTSRWCSRSLAMFASLAAAQSALAQAQWTESVPSFPSRVGHSVVTDPQSNAILFGGETTFAPGNETNDLFTFDGAAWTRVVVANAPPARTQHAAAFDGNRGRMIIFGGVVGQSALGDTWEWDGANWTQIVTPGPSARALAQMTHMAFQQQTALYGGTSGGGETWIYDGSTQTWSQAVTATQPPTATGHTLTYDGPRDVALLISPGTTGSPTTTWEFDGVDWTQQAIGSTPNLGAGHSAFQASVTGAPVVAIGGLLGPALVSETWIWDGANKTWTLSPATGPLGRLFGAGAADANGSFLLVGGLSDNGTGSDTWAFDGTAWSRVVQGTPPGRTGAMVSEGPNGVTVVHGGVSDGLIGSNDDTWIWSVNSWTQFAGATPGLRSDMSGTFDGNRAQLVAFGGIQGVAGAVNETWEFDGTAWNQVMTANAPPARAGSAMAFDSARGVVVLFGGYDPNAIPVLDRDTWEYDGTDWTQITPTTQPPQLETRAMAFDSMRGLCVLLGRPVGGGPLQTWEYDGTNWTSIATANVPPNADGSLAMAYDALRNRCVVLASDGVSSATWEYATDGGTPDWVQRTTPGSAPDVVNGGLAYDPLRQVTVQFSGSLSGTATSTSVFEYGVATPATVRSFGASCSGTLGAATCAAAPGNLPWLGSQFTTQVTGMAANSNAILVYGFTLYPTPIDIGQVIPSLAGCFLFIDNVAQEPIMSNPAGVASATPLQISTDPIMIGFQLYAQAFPLGPGQIIDSTTNSIELTVQER
ncbi:MAG: hypothetical protein NXI31_20770 [bacterium]|nr:hypothetical protein [bacterium]